MSIISAVLAIGFAAESLGLYSHELNTTLAIVFLLLGAVFDPVTRRGNALAPRGGLAGGVVLCALGLLLLPVSPGVRLFAAGLWFWGLDAIARARGHDRAASAALALGCLMAGAYQYAYSSSLLTWYAVQDVSAGLCRLAVWLTGEPMDIGPTFNGLVLLVFALGACAGGAIVASKRRWPSLFVSVVGIVTFYFAFLCTFSILPHEMPKEATSETAPSLIEVLWKAVNPLHVPALLPFLLAFPLGLYLVRLHRSQPEPRSSNVRLPSLALVLMIVVAVWSLTNVPGGRRPGALNVVFYEKGFHNWMVPTHERYGSRSAGMFGNLPLMMQRMGWRAELAPEITGEVLAAADILVIMNQKDPFSEDAIRAIQRFVENGGSLLVLGDHTFAKSPMPGMPGEAAGEAKFLLNEPIENTSIRFRFDSAYYFIGGWLHSLQYWPHQMTAHLGDASNESGCVVGASLETSYPVVPLIVGRYGYADRGDWKAPQRGFMDDGEFNPGAERLGDLVLAAAQDVGRGRVVVVGDTSGFVNMIQAQTWPFTSRAFHWLGSTGRATVPAWREGLALVLLAGAIIVVLIRSQRRIGDLPIACLSFLAAGSVSHAVVARMNRPEPFRDRVAVVDLSHVGRHSIEGWRDNGVAGIYLNLMRKGYFAFGATEFDERQIAEADLFITVAPTRPYTRGEVDFLENYMKAGGTVLLATGWEEQAGARGLLDRFKLTIPPKPQGRASVVIPGTEITPQFWRSWPVLGADETLVTMRNDPIIVRKAVGKGQLVVIGDAGMLMNQNLENEDGANMPNIRFFDWLLDRISKKEPA